MMPHRMHSTPSGCSKPHFGQIMPEILPGHPGMPDTGIPFHEPAGAASSSSSSEEDEILERPEETVKARQRSLRPGTQIAPPETRCHRAFGEPLLARALGREP